ncbi:MAG: hypothetical protein KW802_03740 [Candidatus Doudnabacteria bacterium]|nr:hypothetical protein [Candidatus Doudnabacteria bacterium]
MAKNKSKKVISSLLAERYLVWLVVFIIVTSVGLLAYISLTKTQMDTDIDSSQYLLKIKHK